MDYLYKINENQDLFTNQSDINQGPMFESMTMPINQYKTAMMQDATIMPPEEIEDIIDNAMGTLVSSEQHEMEQIEAVQIKDSISEGRPQTDGGHTKKSMHLTRNSQSK